jgi:hypothetical protein
MHQNLQIEQFLWWGGFWGSFFEKIFPNREKSTPKPTPLFWRYDNIYNFSSMLRADLKSRSSASHAGNPGSNPGGITTEKIESHFCVALFLLEVVRMSLYQAKESMKALLRQFSGVFCPSPSPVMS